MDMRSVMHAIGAVVLIWGSLIAYGQAPGTGATNSARALTDQELKHLLVWNSPWEGTASNSSGTFSYRTTFIQRRDELIATVIRYSTNERGDSTVTIKDGRVNWQDAAGAEVSISVEGMGDLVGTATSKNTNYSVVFRSRR